MFNFTDITTADLANLAEALNASLRGNTGDVNDISLGLIASTRDAAANEINKRMAAVIEPVQAPETKATADSKLPSLGTAQSRHFTAMAEDAGNWTNNPWVDGQGNFPRVPKDVLDGLEKKGVIIVSRNEDGVSAHFTAVGRLKAAEMGISIVD